MIFKRQREKPGPGQESVWDYPRPPLLEKINDELRVVFAGETIAHTKNAWRILETSHPPVYYIPREDIGGEFIEDAPGGSYCEFKGNARYFSIVVGNNRSDRAAWCYPEPVKRFGPIKDYLAFYASKVDECWVNDEKVKAQEGDFYGGWITSKIVGPFKGAPGTRGW